MRIITPFLCSNLCFLVYFWFCFPPLSSLSSCHDFPARPYMENRTDILVEERFNLRQDVLGWWPGHHYYLHGSSFLRLKRGWDEQAHALCVLSSLNLHARGRDRALEGIHDVSVGSAFRGTLNFQSLTYRERHGRWGQVSLLRHARKWGSNSLISKDYGQVKLGQRSDKYEATSVRKLTWSRWTLCGTFSQRSIRGLIRLTTALLADLGIVISTWRSKVKKKFFSKFSLPLLFWGSDDYASQLDSLKILSVRIKDMWSTILSYLMHTL